MTEPNHKQGPIFTEFQSPIPERKPSVIIRRKSLLKKLLHAPGDLYFHLLERYELIEWERHHQALSWPVGIILNLLFLSTQSISLDVSDFHFDYPSILSTRSSIDTYGQVATSFQIPSFLESLLSILGLHQWMICFQVVLGSISVVNALYLFRKTKIYHILEVDPKHLPKSENVRQVLLDESLPNWAQHFPGNIFWPTFMRKWSRNLNSKQKPAYELQIWDISVFHQNLFCLFSPIQVFIFVFFSMDLFTILLLIFLPTMLFYIFEKYNTLVADKQVLFGHVLREYDVKFIHPRLFYQRKDASTSSEPIPDYDEDAILQQRSNGIHESPLASPLYEDSPKLNPFQSASTARKRLFS